MQLGVRSGAHSKPPALQLQQPTRPRPVQPAEGQRCSASCKDVQNTHLSCNQPAQLEDRRASCHQAGPSSSRPSQTSPSGRNQRRYIAVSSRTGYEAALFDDARPRQGPEAVADPTTASPSPARTSELELAPPQPTDAEGTRLGSATIRQCDLMHPARMREELRCASPSAC